MSGARRRWRAGLLLLAGCAGGAASEDAAVPDAGVEVGPATVADAAGESVDAPESLADAEPVDALIERDGAAAMALDCSQICNAATPRYPTVDELGGTGNVTMYTTEPSNGGACNYGATNVSYFAAINVNVSPGDDQGQWQGGRICGQCVEVTALTTQGPRTVVVRIMDRCPDVSCGIDLGGLAPAAIMLDGYGRYDGAWRFVSCAGHAEVSDGVPSIVVGTGSNAWWSRIQVRNPPWPVASVAWRDPAGAAAGEFPYAADPENTFAVPTEVLQSSVATLQVTVTYRDGSTATALLGPAALATPGAAYPLE